jgi:hypothetical protein
MITKLTIISTCTNRKKTGGVSPILLDDCADGGWNQTLTNWLAHMQAPGRPKNPACQVYGGTHWHETLAGLASAIDNGFHAKLWVMSAGAGLIPANHPIPSYSATFTNGANSIHNLDWPKESTPRSRCRNWWLELNSRRQATLPQSLQRIGELSRPSDERCIIVICSRDYFFAVEPELIKLAAKAKNLLIFSAGISSSCRDINPILSQCIAPIDERFKQIAPDLNRVNFALNARIARWVIEEHANVLRSGASAVIELLAQIAKSLPPLERRTIVKMTDEEVTACIAQQCQPDRASATKLLHYFRTVMKKSCEQKRFGRLFAQFEKTKKEGEWFNGIHS